MPAKKKKSRPRLKKILDLIHFTQRVSTLIHGKLSERSIYKSVIREAAASNLTSPTIFLLAPKGQYLKLFDTALPLKIVRRGEKAAGITRTGFRIDLSHSAIFRNVVTRKQTCAMSAQDIVKELLPGQAGAYIIQLFNFKKKDTILTPLFKKGAVTGVLIMSYTEYAGYLSPSVKSLALHISNAVDTAHQISERKSVEKALRQSEKQYRELTDFLPHPVFEADLTGKITFANKAAFELSGYTPFDLKQGVYLIETLVPEDRQRGLKNLQR
ncbi:MAG: PAS domain S-box protein, partial [Chitinivibrionales bacterium]|nr:PAS domain S-box protein [Chitinivibrionales bacterium]